MATISKVKNSNFDAEKTLDVFSCNDGVEMTTDGILEGWENVKKDLEKTKFVERTKHSAFYIQEKQNP